MSTPTPPGPPPSQPPPGFQPQGFQPPGPPPSAPPVQPATSPQGAAGQPTPGFISLTVQGNVMTSNALTPTVLLNGHQMKTHYGENTFPVPPGTWRVEVYCQWLRRYGQAQMDVQIGEGQATRLFYAPPFHQFSTGAIGYEKQKRKGVAVFAALMVFIVLVVVLAVVGGLLG